jgi:hypothetical protein
MSLLLTVLLTGSENVEEWYRRTGWKKTVSEMFVKTITVIKEYKMALTKCGMISRWKPHHSLAINMKQAACHTHDQQFEARELCLEKYAQHFIL